jgi:hypothetical protein
VENAAAECRSSALSVLARSEPAETEARLAYEAKMRSSAHRYATRADAKEAAEVAQQARERTARHLLSTRTAAVRAGQFAAAQLAAPTAPVAATVTPVVPVTPVAAADSEPDPYAAGAARARAAMRGRARQ